MLDKYRLERCPFCGGPAELRETPRVPKGVDYTPRCKDPSCCGRSSKEWPSKDEAVKRWNMRRKEPVVYRNEVYD